MELFSKWDQFKKDSVSGALTTRRPLVASECDSVGEAEKWRRELVRDITKKISAIHNASLGEHRIRELNDEINKLMSKKHQWEKRINELGGKDLTRVKTALCDIEGKALPGTPHYKYYGAAKELPGVRELFSEEEEFFKQRRAKIRRSKADLYKNITPDYYGFRDDDDGLLAPKEAEMAVRKQNAALHVFNEKKRKLEDQVRETQGGLGAQELQQMLDAGSEEEVNFLLSAAVREGAIQRAIDNALAAQQRARDSGIKTMEDLVDQRKQALLDSLA